MANQRFLIVIGALAAGAATVSFGTRDTSVGFSSVLALFTDTLRDADQAGLKATRMSDAEEMRTGAQMAARFTAVQDPALTAYVEDVGRPVVKGVRRPGIRYQFHVVRGRQVNAFALPGGQVVVMSGLLDFVQSEAELAAVLGHEVSHIDLRHCVERYQYQQKFGTLAGIAHQLATLTFSPQQEIEADLQGERLSVEAGYDPDAAASLFHRMHIAFRERERRRARTPAGEIVTSAEELLGDFFRSHPLSEERAAALKRMVDRNQERLAGRTFYIGRQNAAQRVARSREEYPDEFRRL
jgi:predicted Zn-dependent protease